MFEGRSRGVPGRNEPCWCGSGRKYKKCHLPQDRGATPKRSSIADKVAAISSGPTVKTAEQIAGIRAAGVLTREILDLLTDRVKPGVTTNQIDRWVVERTQECGAIAATLGYKGYTKSCCTSINEVICHGIPEDRELLDGDIVNIDVTPVLDGYYGDASRMYMVGNVSPAARRLVEVTHACLERGIAAVRDGARLGDIGHAIQTHAEANGFSVVRAFVGHGTGVDFHEEPQVPHYGRRGHGALMKAGTVFTIEPMINAGHWDARILDDGWTAVTADGSLSAQWEHTILVTEDGVEKLTA